MSLRVVCCFSLLTGPDGWQDSHHAVRQFVNALKDRPLNGYAYVRLFPGTLRKRLDQLNVRDAVDWFGDMAAAALFEELGRAPTTLVPVPDSRCARESDVSRTSVLAEAIAARMPMADVADCLRFDRVMHSSHDAQGARDPRSLYLHLRLRDDAPRDAGIVLVDDVMTTGGHMAAAAAVLRAASAQVLLGLCAASADRVPACDPFDRVVRVIPDYQPARLPPESCRYRGHSR